MATAFANETIETGLAASQLRAGMNVALTRFGGFSVVGEVLSAPEADKESSVIVRPEPSLFSLRGIPHVVTSAELDAGLVLLVEQEPPVEEAQVIESHLQAIAANGPVQEEHLF